LEKDLTVAGYPLVSVVMPVHNTASFVEEAATSILRQTLSDIELIVVDDGSTDATPEILGRLSESDSRLWVVRQEHSGWTDAFNRGWSLARAKYVARMDADDIAHPTRLERQLDQLESHPSLGVIGGRVRYIDEAGNPRGYWQVPRGPTFIRWALLFGTALANSTATIRRSAVRREPPCCVTYAEDYDLWVHVAAHADLDNLFEVLVDRRVHAGSVSRRRAAQMMQATDEIRRSASSRLLAVDLSEAEANALAAVVRPDDAEVTALRDLPGVMSRLLHAYMDSWPLSRREAVDVRRDATTRIGDVARAVRGTYRAEAVRLSLASALLRARLL
jgi:glycosyltransferase involved in cell wall biosynthesis